MDNYRQMAVKYLKLNKRRSIVTIIGVAVAVTVLYAILNLGWCRLLQHRKELREEQDYEIVFLTETAEQAEQIMADERVKSASAGQYYDYSYYEPVLYETALYINTHNPYRLEKILKELENAYGVKGKMNIPLAETYLQGENGNLTFVLILYVLLISFIFAIFGVGIVRNAIQLSILEQIKDYGNLRCIGSTKSQMKSVVYIQGAVLELAGNALGILFGFIASLIIGYLLKWEVGFHIIPIIPILIAFLGDLYFAMEENCKVLAGMTPVSAIRGEYRIRKEKFKARKQSIFGKIFGIEGDYAYKSIMRNPGRFHKTVWALGVGMAAIMAVMGAAATANGRIKAVRDMCGYYHVYYGNTVETYDTVSEVQSRMLPPSAFQAVADLNGVTDAKRIYAAEVYLKDRDANFAHYTEDYLLYTAWGDMRNMIYNNPADEPDGSQYFSGIQEIVCYGYDETDFQRYEQALTAGTLDISENGLVLINGGSVCPKIDEEMMDEEDIDLNELQYMDVEYTDYQVGDTIDIVDMQKYRTMYTEKVEELIAEHDAEIAKLRPLTKEEKNDWKEYQKTPHYKLDLKYYEDRRLATEECRKKLIAEGSYKTYTIEGIVSRDVNHYSEGDVMEFVLPLDRYYAFTGMDESAVTGMQYHFEQFSELEFAMTVNSNSEGRDSLWTVTDYPTLMSWILSLKILLRGILLFVIFVLMMTTFNIINTTASNLHMRRKEFAQLRVIGISKERLMKMVLLEGVITTLTADLIGIVLGTILSFASIGMVVIILLGGRMHFPFLSAVIGIVVSLLILCGSIYVPLKGLKQDMAADLATGGD